MKSKTTHHSRPIEPTSGETSLSYETTALALVEYCLLDSQPAFFRRSRTGGPVFPNKNH